MHITRGHIVHQHLTVRVPHRIGARNRLTVGTAPTRAGSQRLRVFSLRHKRLCAAPKPEDIGFAGGDPIPPPMSPLRAVVSRGHIAGDSAFALCSVGLRESPFHCSARCAPSRYSSLRCGPSLALLDCARFAGGWLLRLHAGATTSQKTS